DPAPDPPRPIPPLCDTTMKRCSRWISSSVSRVSLAVADLGGQAVYGLAGQAWSATASAGRDLGACQVVQLYPRAAGHGQQVRDRRRSLGDRHGRHGAIPGLVRWLVVMAMAARAAAAPRMKGARGPMEVASV